jgi:hypothetical protein
METVKMRKTLMALAFLALLATACAGPANSAAPTTEPTVPATSEPATPAIPPESAPLSDAEAAALAQLAQALGLPADQITVVSAEAVEWPDSCLGISYPNARCAQAITPGYRIRLAAGGAEYVYHTNADGSAVVAAVPSLAWHREGGIAGFCDDLLISGFGQAQATSCRTGEAYPAGALTAAEQAQLDEWSRDFSAVVIEQVDPAAADGMTVMLTFSGAGADQPTEAEQQAMVAWAQAVYERLANP